MNKSIKIVKDKIEYLKKNPPCSDYCGMVEAMVDDKVHSAKIDILEDILYELKKG